MPADHSASLQAILQFALPLGTQLISGSIDTTITWAVMVRAQPPAFPDLYGGELALVSMEMLRSYDTRLTLADVIRSLGSAGVRAIAVKEDISSAAIDASNESSVALLALPEDGSLPRIERDVNALIVNQQAQMTQRAMEIQRQLTRVAAENRDLNSLLSVLARATAKPVVLHDDAGVLMAQVYPNASRKPSGQTLLQNLPYGAFQNWLHRDAPTGESTIVASPIGYTTVLKVEKRTAGYLSLIDNKPTIDEFDRIVLGYGADVCAIELAKNRAIASAVEQTRGDWVQMWLSSTSSDDALMTTRAEQSGFSPRATYLVVVFRPLGTSAPTLETIIAIVRDDMTRRQIAGAIGQYVDAVVAFYPLDSLANLPRLRRLIDDARGQIVGRAPGSSVGVGISRPARGLLELRGAYREARDAVNIAYELGDRNAATFYGDLKLFQLLLALKDRNLDHLQRFFQDTLAPLVDHDERKQGDLIRTLSGFFAANGNLAKAASELDVHRNTLVYRLERISELTGLDLDDPENRLILHLSLKIQRVLAALPGSFPVEDG